MTPLLSVVIASHNERPEALRRTVASIIETAGTSVEIVMVDDCSVIPICGSCLGAPPGMIRSIRNKTRMGVGPSRHLGVESASGQLILITDAHVVFDGDWYKSVYAAFGGNPKMLLCGQCVALAENAWSIENPIGTYNGARMVIHDSGAEPRWRVLTAKWAKDKPGQDFYPLSAVMGACYAMRKDFFLEIGGLKMLREFGGDEELLSIKTILAGGEIRMFKKLRIGHRFRQKQPVPYRITIETCLYNTGAIALTCCPPDVAKDLIGKIGPGREWVDAKRQLWLNREALEEERVRLSKVFSRNWDEYLKIISEIDG